MERNTESAASAARLEQEIDELRGRLREAEEELRAIREGEVDALVVGTGAEEIYTLERPEHPFRLLVDQMTHAAAALTGEGTILCSNEAFGKLVHRSPATLQGLQLHELLAPQCQAALDAMLAKAPTSDAEAMLILQVEDAAVALPFCLHAIGTSAFGVTLMLSDLSEHKRVEEIERAQAALRRSEEALRLADKRKDEFLATLAHELRNPLAPMRNAVEFLRAKGTSAPELRWAHDVIDRQVQLMARLLEDLLDVSRVALDRPNLRHDLVELGTVVDAAVETSFPLMERAKHVLTVTLPPEPIYLEADAVRLAQVFANLLNNAAKYTDDGGRIRLVAEKRRDEVEVSISDTGIGISTELLPKIFEIFSQARPASGRSQGGLGIGLSLVKGLVELHGGAVEAYSEGPGKGSTFRVRLPIADAVETRKATRPPEKAASASRRNRRVLVVDDHRDSADSLAMLLKAMGHDVEQVYEGERAIELASKMLPDLVLLDIGMPRLDGYEVCRLIKGEPWGEGMVVVALTGWGQDEDRVKSLAAGFDHHLVKPVESGELSRLIGSLESPGGEGDGDGRVASRDSDARETRMNGGHGRARRRPSDRAPAS
jgi:signal transduction histidine kinase/ActR/RegA family two-component response regulator